jgi:protein phosphatase
MEYEYSSMCRRNGRLDNQDFIFCSEKKFGLKQNILMLGVCDGMGGMEKGTLISSLAAWVFEVYFAKGMTNSVAREENPLSIKKTLINAFVNTNRKVHSYMIQNDINGGTTMSVAVLLNDDLYFANVGDSPCYLIDQKKETIQLISNIENKGYQMLKSGELKDKDSYEYQKNACLLLNYIGVKKEKFIRPDIYYCKLQPDQMILMGSDGFFGELDEKELYWKSLCLNQKQALENIADNARTHGTTDNQSGIICRIF